MKSLVFGVVVDVVVEPGEIRRSVVVDVVGVEVGDTPCRACRTRERAGDEGTRRCCQYRTCEDREHHEPCEPELEGLAKKFSVTGRCVEVVRR